jgi:nitrate reductase gamma subunit
MSQLLHFAEHPLQEAALCFMAIVYIARVKWLLGFKAGRDRQAPTGVDYTTPARGILYSWGNIAMPWAMESTRKNPFLYAQFVVFHLGVVASIGLSFVIPYAPGLLANPIFSFVLRALIAGAFLTGLLRIVRRLRDPYLRAISSPDDYFSLILLTVWFAFAFLSVPNRTDHGEWALLVYFFLTAFFLMYVPFSKISHYLYYPFTRYYFGKTMGHRGVFPVRRGAPVRR